MTALDQRRPDAPLEGVDQARERPRRGPQEVDDDQAGRRRERAGLLDPAALDGPDAGRGVQGTQRSEQMDVVMLAYHRVRRVAPRLPERAAVEPVQSAPPGCHVGEPPDPDEAVRLVDD